jgi:preprotein translocase subunit Sec63
VFLLSFFLAVGVILCYSQNGDDPQTKDLTKDRLHAKYESNFFENFAISLAN